MTNNLQSKHLGKFWPIFILVAVSMVAGGIIYAVAFDNQIQDEINSAVFIPSKNIMQNPATTSPSKPPLLHRKRSA